MEHEAKAQHHEQQARTTKTQKRQCHARERKHARHRADVDDHVRHDETEYTGNDQAHRRVIDPVNDEQQPAQQCKEQEQYDYEADKAERFAENSKDRVVNRFGQIAER